MKIQKGIFNEVKTGKSCLGILLLFIFCFSSHDVESAVFIHNRLDLGKVQNNPNVLLVASTGRSGSSMLTHHLEKQVTHFTVMKTHLLPPDPGFKGKIVFIYSNPDKAAESILHLTIKDKYFGISHFLNMETANRSWLQAIGDTTKQTVQDNLLSFDALGCFKHLRKWLVIRTTESHARDAQIFAVKYENLWDVETIEALRRFLRSNTFALPRKRQRGYPKELLDLREIAFRQEHNVGTEEDPKYPAYSKARKLWKNAPPYQFLRIKQ